MTLNLFTTPINKTRSEMKPLKKLKKVKKTE